ncbi:E3 ubiquitin-protein ligase TRIM56-like isoform X2 [Ptychodera flava]|uniref:E3 ubiquitin-protein ligase TRIM56-like isoform X2 n=1 Tax=Ptychodera flava TaxID=63121 RepID=UPI003969D146
MGDCNFCSKKYTYMTLKMASNVEQSVHMKIVSDIDEQILECTVCYKRLVKPKILPCVHTFCEKCLDTWVAKNGGKLMCPTCRSEFPLPETGVSGLGNNLFINDLLDIFSKVRSESPEKTLSCELCERDALYWCKECAQLFCDSCRSSHGKLRILRNHTFISTEEYGRVVADGKQAQLLPRFCNRHSQSQLEFFCDSCQVTVCIRCAVTSHKGDSHHLLSLEEATQQYTPVLESLEQELGRAITSMKAMHEAEKKGLADFQREISDTEAKIRAHAQNWMKRIKKEEEKLLKEVRQVGETKRKQIEADVGAIELDLERLENTYAYVKHFLRYGSHADVLAQKSDIESQLKDVTAKSLTTRQKIEKQPRRCVDFEIKPLPERIVLGTLKSNSTEQHKAEETIARDSARKGKSRHATRKEITASPPQQETKLATSITDSTHSQSDFRGFDSPMCDACKLAVITCAVKLPCRHQFCQRCLRPKQGSAIKCLVCDKIYGDMPFGTMCHDVSFSYLPGFGCTTLVVTYDFPPGKQQAIHPKPGEPFEGATFLAYLPNDNEGQEILRLLKIAFERRLTFTIDATANTVTWNGITHKVSRHGSAAKDEK